MRKYKELIFALLILFFLIFSFYPTIFELSQSAKVSQMNRHFILEHNYYWPDFNLYLSKIKQGANGQLTAKERYTSEKHKGSLIQEFYIVLGLTGKILGISPNFSYQLGRLVLSPLLLLIIYLLIRSYFKNICWQVIGFLTIVMSGSFPRLYNTQNASMQIGRYMEWWSNIDSLQRITFIPHILFGQAITLFLLYQFTFHLKKTTAKKLIFFILLGNLAGLVFPPSLITLNSVLLLMMIIKLYKYRSKIQNLFTKKYINSLLALSKIEGLFIIVSSLSLLYIFILTRQIPWSALVHFHRTHPMMIPFAEYIKGTGPVFYLGMIGAIIAVFNRKKKLYPLIFWIITTLGFAVIFTHIKEQSPLRFTQTGLFIPLGILCTYFFHKIWQFSQNTAFKTIIAIFVFLYLLENLFIMKTSLNWQTSWITQRVNASLPQVPYPPQTMYPLKDWMAGIRWLEFFTDPEDVVLAEITAGNYIPAYSGNTVYFGQSNTVDYEEKQELLWQFFQGKMSLDNARSFLKTGRIKYIFFSVQEKSLAKVNDLRTHYSFLEPVFENPLVTIYKYNPSL